MVYWFIDLSVLSEMWENQYLDSKTLGVLSIFQTYPVYSLPVIETILKLRDKNDYINMLCKLNSISPKQQRQFVGRQNKVLQAHIGLFDKNTVHTKHKELS